MDNEKGLKLRVTAIRYVARDIHAFELSALDGSELPACTPGSHLDLALPNGLRRQYSLVHTPAQPLHYVVGVKRDAGSRGGSQFLHEQLRVGTVLAIQGPSSNFPLREDAPHSVFFAGGIGVTPIVAMLERLAQLQRPRSLYYACRSRADLAFLPELSRVTTPVLHIDDEQSGYFDIAAVVRTLPGDAHLYCCGPGPMLAAFEAATAAWPPEQVHVEYFAPREAAATGGGYTVELARSQREFRIPPGKTILQVLREGGVAVASSCEEGVCAACETAVLSGVPDHRDAVLSAGERASNSTMMICCSGSQSERLVLDI